ncbi:MAG: multiheme c-type cytochrome [bacterium]|nr:multiheme c-type cytochrome [bacterium]
MKRVLLFFVCFALVLASCNADQKDLRTFSVEISPHVTLDSLHVVEGARLLFIAKTYASSQVEAFEYRWFAFLRIGTDSIDISTSCLNELQNDSVWFTVPDTSGRLVTLRCIASWVDGSGTGEITFPLFRYQPAEHPAFLGENASCNACHAPYFRAWSQTSHATAGYHRRTQSSWSNACNECHTTGYLPTINNGGFDERPVSAYDHVRCESCHGPSEYYGESGINHTTANGFRGAVILPDSVCLKCHTDYHQPLTTQWRSSRHANSATHSVFAALSQPELDRCSPCHIARESIRRLDGDSLSHWPSDPNEQIGIGCVVCHDPHATRYSLPNGKSLRKPVDELCAACHQAGIDGTPSLTNHPHHPQSDLLENRLDAILRYPSAVYPAQGSHEGVQGSCIYCHVTGSGSLVGQAMASGHTFTVLVSTCQQCHSNAGNNYIALQQDTVLTLMNRLQQGLELSIQNGDSTSEGFLRARWTYLFLDRDGSLGIHNYVLTRAMLLAIPAEYLP